MLSPARARFWIAKARRRLARRQRQRRHAAFHRRDALLQHVVGRVHDAGVDVAQFLQAEQVGGVLGAVELVRRGLVDRHRDRVVAGSRRQPACSASVSGCFDDEDMSTISRMQNAEFVGFH